MRSKFQRKVSLNLKRDVHTDYRYRCFNDKSTAEENDPKSILKGKIVALFGTSVQPSSRGKSSMQSCTLIRYG